MKIGVISDTHFVDLAAGLSFFDALCQGPFADVELILHAGDVIHPDLLSCFDTRPVAGVCGNCDEPSALLPEKRVQQIGGYRIGMIHGWGGPAGIVGNVLSAFEDVQLDALVFGHSHYPLNRHNSDLLLFNPGSATDRRDAPFHSVGILELGDRIQGSIVNIDVLFEQFVNPKGVCA